VTGERLSGAALIAKLLQGESGALSDPEKARTAVSSAGAKGWGQFMPGSRQEAISKFGIDPWRSADEAIHATALHLRGKINGSTGLEGYNPGDPTYTDYILGQKVGHLAGSALKGAARGGAASSAMGAMPPAVTQVGGGMVAPSGLLDVPAGASLSQALQSAVRPVMPSAGVAPPSFAAGPTMAGAGPIPMGGGPGPAPQVQLPDPTQASLPGPAVPTDGIGLSISPADAAGGADANTRVGGKVGKVVVGPKANRDGVGLQKPLMGFLRQVSAGSGREVDVTYGTNHNQYVINTNRESDHWRGNAADLGVGGDARQDRAAGHKGDVLAAHAIQEASDRAGERITYAKALQMAKQGGVFNFDTPDGRIQVLWRTLTGGNHFNHVHVGLNPGA
jgi:hypothetical protein